MARRSRARPTGTIRLVSTLLVLASFGAQRESNLQAQQLIPGKSYDVLLPAGYDSTRVYPLLVVLHGAYGNKESLQPYFVPDLYAARYICLFAQSTEKSRGGYNWWNRIKEGRKLIRRSFDEVVGLHSVDTERVVIGGFSAGGTMAIDVAMQGVIPTLGFVAHCPGMPQEFDSLLVASLSSRGLRGVIIAGRNDYFRPYQLDMVDLFESGGFEHQFVIIPSLGHDVTANLPNLLDAALQFLDPSLKTPMD